MIWNSNPVSVTSVGEFSAEMDSSSVVLVRLPQQILDLSYQASAFILCWGLHAFVFDILSDVGMT